CARHLRPRGSYGSGWSSAGEYFDIW
nr:immunoglobulin heavy chain junction region [Macaca mulatta]